MDFIYNTPFDLLQFKTELCQYVESTTLVSLSIHLSVIIKHVQTIHNLGPDSKYLETLIQEFMCLKHLINEIRQCFEGILSDQIDWSRVINLLEEVKQSVLVLNTEIKGLERYIDFGQYYDVHNIVYDKKSLRLITQFKETLVCLNKNSHDLVIMYKTFQGDIEYLLPTKEYSLLKEMSPKPILKELVVDHFNNDISTIGNCSANVKLVMRAISF